jgi:hypothetical protein
MSDHYRQAEFPKFAEGPYGRRLRHPKWQRRRLEAMLLADWRCSRCGDCETPLEVHHTNYRAGAEPWEYPLTELRVLCERCHEFEHVPVSADGCCFGRCGPLGNEPPGHERPCAYNQATCCRYHRLGALLSAMEPRVKRRLRSLSDHKGLLTAHWRFEPPCADKVHVAQLWATVGKEFSDAVQHTTGTA